MRLSRKLFLLLVLLSLTVVFFIYREQYGFLYVPDAPSVKEREDAVSPESIRRFTFSRKEDIEEWESRLLSKRATQYEIKDLNGIYGVMAESDDSASALFYRERLSAQKRPFLKWKWQVIEFPDRRSSETLTDKTEFDFGAQIYVIFYSRFFLNAKAIQYVWTEDIPEGTVVDSPYTKNVKIMVLESGASEGIIAEDRDINADYEKAFGVSTPEDIMAISFMTDSDSTDSQAKAFYTDIELGYIAPETSNRSFILRKWIHPSNVEVKKPDEKEQKKQKGPLFL